MKALITIVAILFVTNFGYSQSPKLIQRANQQVEKINSLLVSESPDFALTEEQKTQMRNIFIQKIKDIRAVKKSGLSSDESKLKKKAINKEVNKKIRKEILTKEQRNALKVARKKQKHKK